MGVPTSEVGYTSATTGRGDHEVRKGHVVACGGKKMGGGDFVAPCGFARNGTIPFLKKSAAFIFSAKRTFGGKTEAARPFKRRETFTSFMASVISRLFHFEN
jgi:hypothetical protein